MKPHLLIILLLLPITVAYSNQNLLDFMQSAYTFNNCTEQLNLTHILSEENQTPPSALKIAVYMKRPDCENLMRSTYHYFQLQDPQFCPELYTKMHEWWGLWNWGFYSCTISFTKQNATHLIHEYVSQFNSGALIIHNRTKEKEKYINTTHAPPPMRTQELTKQDIVFGSVGSVPNILLIELLLLALSLLIGRYAFWSKDEWKQTISRWGSSPATNMVFNLRKQIKYTLLIFIALNVLFWAGYTLITT